jgi:hypothetical protein
VTSPTSLHYSLLTVIYKTRRPERENDSTPYTKTGGKRTTGRKRKDEGGKGLGSEELTSKGGGEGE